MTDASPIETGLVYEIFDAAHHKELRFHLHQYVDWLEDQGRIEALPLRWLSEFINFPPSTAFHLQHPGSMARKPWELDRDPVDDWREILVALNIPTLWDINECVQFRSTRTAYPADQPNRAMFMCRWDMGSKNDIGRWRKITEPPVDRTSEFTMPIEQVREHFIKEGLIKAPEEEPAAEDVLTSERNDALMNEAIRSANQQSPPPWSQ